MRKVLVVGVGIGLLAGLWWWSAQDAPSETEMAKAPTTKAPTKSLRSRSRRLLLPPVLGSPCRVKGAIENGRARRVDLHAERAGVDLPGQIEGDGRQFTAELPEQGRIFVVATATDDRTVSTWVTCGGDGQISLTLAFEDLPSGAGRISGTCRYLETGAPVSEAVVRGTYGSYDTRTAFSGVANSEGVFSLAVAPGTYGVRCAKDADESDPVPVTVDAATEVSVELFVEARAGISGMVVDADGVGQGLVTVSAYSPRNSSWRRKEEVTDADGRFLMMGLLPGPVVVEAHHDGQFAEAQVTAKVELPYADARLELGASWVSVEGTVMAGGEPVVGATVEARPAVRVRRGEKTQPVRRVTTTDASGRFTLGGLVPGVAEIYASSPGWAASEARTDLGPGKNVVQIELQSACTAEVVVQPAEPSRPVRVRAFLFDQRSTPKVVAGQTGESLRFEGVHGQAMLEARTTAGLVATATLTTNLCESGAPIVLSLDAVENGGQLTVHVQDDTGAPVSEVTVWVMARDRPGRPRPATTGPEGTVRFELPPGEYRVGAEDVDPKAVIIVDKETETVVFEVPSREGIITGTVIGGTGPVEGARIRAACMDSGRSIDVDALHTVGRSEGDGSFSFTPNDGTVCTVQAEHRTEGTSAPVTLRTGDSGRLELRGSGSIAGQVVNTETRDPVSPYILEVSSELGDRRSLHIADPSGRFEVLDLPAGRVALSVQSDVGRGRVAVELRAGEKRSGVEIDVYRNARIEGRVLDQDRQPVAGARISVETTERRRLGRLVSGPDGTYTQLVPAGAPIQVHVRADGYYPQGSPPVVLEGPTGTRVPDLILEPRGDPEEKEGGIGIQFGTESDGIRILRFMDDSPAREAGLEMGDTIVGIDGAPFGKNPIVNWVTRIRGPVGTPVVLDIRRGTQSPFSVSVVRRAVGLRNIPD